MVANSLLDDPVETRHELVRRGVESLGEAYHDSERRIAGAALDLREIREADPRAIGQVGQRQVLVAPQVAQPCAEYTAEPLLAFAVWHDRIVRITTDRPSRRRHFALSSFIYGRTS